MTQTRWWKYLSELMGNETATEAAKKSKISSSNFTRWKKGARADPDFVVKIARAYDANVLEALVEAEFITEEEAGLGNKKSIIDRQAISNIQKTAQSITEQQKALQKTIKRVFSPELMQYLKDTQELIDSLTPDEKEAIMRDELDFDSPASLAEWRAKKSNAPAKDVPPAWDGEGMPPDAVADSSPEIGGSPDDLDP